jgi:hypothetical protein
MGDVEVALRSLEKGQKALRRSDLPPIGFSVPPFFQNFYGERLGFFPLAIGELSRIIVIDTQSVTAQELV